MALRKKERRITIAIGLVIGVTMSSMLVKHALKVKDEQTSNKPGNYNSSRSAVDNVWFPDLPQAVRQAIPNGIVVFFEGNRTNLSDTAVKKVNTWVIETSGSFRSERLFILAEATNDESAKVNFYRASEVYVKLKGDLLNKDLNEEFRSALDSDQYRIIGRNSHSSEQIVQVKNFSPTELLKTKKFLSSLSMVESVRFSRWEPGR